MPVGHTWYLHLLVMVTQKKDDDALKDQSLVLLTQVFLPTHLPRG